MTANPWLGKTLGARYRLEEVLGQGGMSAVYKAVDPNLRRTVAIKLIHAHLSDQAEFLRRFEEEAAAVAQLRHPNIVQVYDFNHDGGVYYMVLEHVTGETLQQRLKRFNDAGQRLPLADALRYAAGVCDAVDYAHRQGMIHRDIKPANIMLNDSDQAILMDFGIAKIVGGQQHTATGAVVGTALYMAPEQIRAQPADQRSDVYSLGVTIFEMLSGRPPFESDSAMSLMMMHLSQPAPDLRDLRPEIPSGVANVLHQALEKEPAQRFDSASEMAAALRRELALLPATSTANAAIFEPTIRQAPITPAELAAEAALMRGAGGAVASGVAGLSGSAVSANRGTAASPPNRNTPPGGMTGYGVRPGVTGSHPVPRQRRAMVAGGCALALVLLMCALGTGGLFIGRNAMANQSNAIAMQTIFAATQTIIQETRSAIEFAFTQAAQPAETTPVVDADATRTAVAQATQTAVAVAENENSATATPSLLLAAAQETPRPTAAISVVIIDIHIEGEDIVVDYETVGFIESSSNRHIHFFFNNTPLDTNGQPESGALVMYSGPRPFHGLTIWDVPTDATQLCAIVATRDHEAMPESGTCVDIPAFATPTSAPGAPPNEPKDNDKPGPEY